ncbi:hypothetical protein FQA47_024684 [Oryzias melastigma]|uniref:Uncharacterized protein n=1 Tax=Oryzias melastigma TaxID=30732 RepID=A0A834F653_ORYME|nr:hypothetical protein FQA47_024684 [Oryzias melastigma]
MPRAGRSLTGDGGRNRDKLRAAELTGGEKAATEARGWSPARHAHRRRSERDSDDNHPWDAITVTHLDPCNRSLMNNTAHWVRAGIPSAASAAARQAARAVDYLSVCVSFPAGRSFGKGGTEPVGSGAGLVRSRLAAHPAAEAASVCSVRGRMGRGVDEGGSR